MTRTLTDKQRGAMDAMRAARDAGMGLSAYARANGLNVRQLHDAVTGLRKRGLIPPTDRPRPRKGAFVAVRVTSIPRSPELARPTPRLGMVCRLVHVGGLVIECSEWPPPAWLSAVMAERRDAAS